MFWETLTSLCADNDISPTALCSKLGFSNATATKWKKGATPHFITLKKIADYFNVSVDYLLGKEPEPSTSTSVPDFTYALFRGNEEITDEMQDEINAYAEVVKKRHASGVKKKNDIPFYERPGFWGDEEFIKKHSADRDSILKFALFGNDANDITPQILNDVRQYADFLRKKENDSD